MAAHEQAVFNRGASRDPVEPGSPAVTDLSSAEQQERKRRAKRTAILLALVAGSFYVGFIVLTFFRGQH